MSRKDDKAQARYLEARNQMLESELATLRAAFDGGVRALYQATSQLAILSAEMKAAWTAVGDRIGDSTSTLAEEIEALQDAHKGWEESCYKAEAQVAALTAALRDVTDEKAERLAEDMDHRNKDHSRWYRAVKKARKALASGSGNPSNASRHGTHEAACLCPGCSIIVPGCWAAGLCLKCVNEDCEHDIPGEGRSSLEIYDEVEPSTLPAPHGPRYRPVHDAKQEGAREAKRWLSEGEATDLLSAPPCAICGGTSFELAERDGRTWASPCSGCRPPKTGGK